MTEEAVSSECLETIVFPSVEKEGENPIQYIKATLNSTAFPALDGADFLSIGCLFSLPSCAVATALDREKLKNKRKRIKNQTNNKPKTGGKGKKLGRKKLRSAKKFSVLTVTIKEGTVMRI